MRGHGVIVALLALCGAVVWSSPACADQYDFVMELDSMGVSHESIVDMIDIGKELCHDLRSGATPPVVLSRLRATGFAPAESGIVLMSAVYNLCVDAEAGVIGWARDNNYTGPV